MVIGAWIAGQARNDSVRLSCRTPIRHPCIARTNATRKAVHGRTVPRNQGMSPGLAVPAAPQDVRGAEGGSYPAFVNLRELYSGQ